VSEIRSFWRNAMTFETGVAEMPLRSVVLLTFVRVAKSLDTDLINEVFAL
jgi:hypothetical protein